MVFLQVFHRKRHDGSKERNRMLISTVKASGGAIHADTLYTDILFMIIMSWQAA